MSQVKNYIKGIKMKKILVIGTIFVCIFYGQVSFAIPKQLVCDNNDPEGLTTSNKTYFSTMKDIKPQAGPIGRSIAAYEFACGYQPDSPKDYCGGLEKVKKFVDFCSAQDFLVRYVFVLDTTDLSGTAVSNAEFYSENCGTTWGDSSKLGLSTSPVLNVEMSSTTSIISFKGAHSQQGVFNVDRKTLSSGYATDRSFKCALEDVDTSGNLL
jgi:hypothetical protein|tara:strand:- start:642 stop:1274 length:633 start_codon:yes stop_codon:yes gene_type:complete